jgi:hypothetical protein
MRSTEKSSSYVSCETDESRGRNIYFTTSSEYRFENGVLRSLGWNAIPADSAIRAGAVPGVSASAEKASAAEAVIVLIPVLCG